MQTKLLEACTIDFLGNDIEDFCICDLSEITEQFPVLMKPYVRNFFTIICVEKDSGHIIVDDLSISLEAKKMFVVKSGSVSCIKPNMYAKGKIIFFTDNFYSLRYNDNVLYNFSFINDYVVPYIFYEGMEYDKCRYITDMLYKEYINFSKQTNKVLRSYLNILLFELERSYESEVLIKRNTLGKSQVLKFQKLIGKHYRNKKSPSEYASLLNVTTNHLNKICKKEVGKTAGSLIRKQLIVEAQRLLYHTHCTVSEIAIELGFNNISYFSTFFKNQVGITPEKYRKQIV